MEAAIHELMDLAFNVLRELLSERRLLGDGLFAEELTGTDSWLDGPTGYSAVHSRDVAVLFLDLWPADAIFFRHELLGAGGPASFFTLPG